MLARNLRAVGSPARNYRFAPWSGHHFKDAALFVLGIASKDALLVQLCRYFAYDLVIRDENASSVAAISRVEHRGSVQGGSRSREEIHDECVLLFPEDSRKAVVDGVHRLRERE